MAKHMRKAAFLDRDGVINRDKGYVSRWADFEFLPGAIEGMKRLRLAGYVLVIVTNQSGLARGYYSTEQYEELTRTMRAALVGKGVDLLGVYHCPHHPDGAIPNLSIECGCRKPAPGLIVQAAHDLNLNLTDSLLIGDRPSDLLAARAAGVGRAYMVEPLGLELTCDKHLADGYFPDLLACVNQALLSSG